METVALTFDDGPDPIWTPRLLDVLRRAGARATFFPIAGRAAAHPRLMNRIIREGHTVGLHCEEHVRHSQRDRRWLEGDTDRALSRLAALGLRPTLWRTPWGDTARWSEQVAGERGMRLVGWTADSHDWRGDSAASMFTATAAALRPAAIVLAHDGIGPGARRSGAGETIAYTALVAEHARANGLTLEALR